MKNNNISCPYCHIMQEANIAFEVVFDNFTITFKCDDCKRQVRIYLKMETFGEFVKDG